MAAFLIPAFYPIPVAVVADKDNPTVAEITAFRTNVTQFTAAAGPTLTIGNPAHGFALALPNNTANNANVAARVEQLEELHTYAQSYFNLYAAAYAALMGAIVGGQAPPAPPSPALAPPARHAPKLKMLDEFNGKSTTEAWHFL